MKSKSKTKVLKYITVGDSGVGKTSLLNRFTEDRFDTDTLSTIGVDFKSKVIDASDYISQTS